MYFNAGTIYNITEGQGITNPASAIKQAISRLQSQIRLNNATARAIKIQNELNKLFTETDDMKTYMSNLLTGLQKANEQAIIQAEQSGGRRPSQLRDTFELDSTLLGVKSVSYPDMFTASGKQRLEDSGQTFFAVLNNIKSLNGKLLEAALQRIVGVLANMYDEESDAAIAEVLKVLQKDEIMGQQNYSNAVSLTKTAGSKSLPSIVNFNGTDKKVRFRSAQKSDAIVDVDGWQNGTDIVKQLGISVKNIYGLDNGINVAQHVNFVAMIANSDLFGASNSETPEENFFWRTFFTVRSEAGIFSQLKSLRQLMGIVSISGHHGLDELKSQLLITVVRTSQQPFRVIPIYDKLIPLLFGRNGHKNMLQITWETKEGLPLKSPKKYAKTESLNNAAFRALSTIKYTATLQLTQAQYDSMLK